MLKLELTPKGKEKIQSFKVLLDWLALGGEVETNSGHKLAMTDDGMIGFKATRLKKDCEEEEIIFQCDSDVAFQMLNDKAKQLTEEDRAIFAMNLALNRK